MRPPPLSLRGDFNRSTLSLPSRASPRAYHHGPGFNRARTPNSLRSITPKSVVHRKRRGSTEQSMRSASLTSIVEMYQTPIPPDEDMPPLRSAGSFYYDYTEEFESQPPRRPSLDIPLCPIPQRAGSIHRPLILREDSDTHLDGEIHLDHEETFENQSNSE